MPGTGRTLMHMLMFSPDYRAMVGEFIGAAGLC